jgi:hypothetical protein
MTISNKTEAFLRDLKKAHELSTEGEWKVIAVQGNPEYAPHYGVTSHENTYNAQTGKGSRGYPNVVRATSDWEGYGEGSRLADVLFITEAHKKLPIVLEALEKIIQTVEDNGGIDKDELEEILSNVE